MTGPGGIRRSYSSSALRLAVYIAVIAAVLSIVLQSVAAVPAPDRTHTLTQPDGTTFEAVQWGDETRSGWETVDGYTIRQEDGWWYYAAENADGELYTTDRKVGVVEPTGIEQQLRPEEPEKHLRLAGESGAVHTDALPSSGSIDVPVILINFNDTSTSYPQNEFDSLLFDEDPDIATGPGSLRDYYEEVSYGQAELSGTVSTWVTADNGHDYYGEDGNNSKDKRYGELITEAIRKADSQLDYSNYDNDGDGVVDSVIVIHQGPGQEVSGDSTDIWSKRSTFTGSGVQTDDGVAIKAFSVQPESTPRGKLTTIGVIAHETGHLFGLPDLYDTNASLEGDSEGIGHWGLMGSGSYTKVNRSGDSPAHMMAWSKSVLGWVNPTKIPRKNGTGELSPLSERPTAYQLLDNPHGTTDWVSGDGDGEYFLLANRGQTGFDNALPGDGVLIWHVNESRRGNANESRKLVDLEAADGDADLDELRNPGDAGDPFSATSVRSMPVFGNETTPSSRLYNGSDSGVRVNGFIEHGNSMSLPTLIDSCTNIDRPGEYLLTRDLINESTVGTCISISANDVVLHGGDHTIEGNGTTDEYGIRVVGQQDITISNLTLTGWKEGVSFDGVSESSVRNLRLESNEKGLFTDDAYDLRVTGNTFEANGDEFSGAGMRGFNTNRTVLANNTFRDSPYGVNVYRTADWIVRDNSFHNASSSAISLRKSWNVTVRETDVHIAQRGIDVIGENVTIANNSVAFANTAIEGGGLNAYVRDNEIDDGEGATPRGIVASGNVTVVSNHISNTGTGIYAEDRHDFVPRRFTVADNHIIYSQDVGIEVRGRFDDVVRNNTVGTAFSTGIVARGTANRTVFVNNTVENAGDDDVTYDQYRDRAGMTILTDSAVVRGNQINDSEGPGIYVEDGDYPHNHTIAENVLRNDEGIRFTRGNDSVVRGNRLLDSSCGIVFDEPEFVNTNVSNVVVADNRIDTSGADCAGGIVVDTIETLRLTNTTVNGSDVEIDNSEDVTLKGVEVRNARLSGISFWYTNDVTVEYTLLVNTSVEIGGGSSIDLFEVNGAAINDTTVLDSGGAAVGVESSADVVGNNVSVARDDGTSLSFEANDVTLDRAEAPPGPPPGKVVVGVPIELGIPFDATAPWLNLTVHYDESALAGANESTLELNSHAGTSWEPVFTATALNTGANTVQSNVTAIGDGEVIAPLADEAEPVNVSGSINEADGDPADTDTLISNEIDGTHSDLGATIANGSFQVAVAGNAATDLQYYQTHPAWTFGGASSLPEGEVAFPTDASPDLYALDRVAVSTEADLGEYDLPSAHRVNVTATDADGNPVENATVTIVHRNDNTGATVKLTPFDGTNADGKLELDGSDGVGIELVGNVTVQVEPPADQGYANKTYERTFDVTGDESISIDVETSTTCINEAVAGDDGVIQLDEIQEAIDRWATDEEVPNTGGETISLSKIQGLIDAWATDEKVSC